MHVSLVFLSGLDPFFSPIRAQIRPCLEYDSHLWREASKHSLANLDVIQRQAIRLIKDPTIINGFDSLVYRRTDSTPLSLL